MNTLVDAAESASFQDGSIVIVFESGVEIRFPIGKNPRLAKGSAKQLGKDRDLSIRVALARIG